MKQFKVLVVDDDDNFRLSLVETLSNFKEFNLTIFEAKVGSEALKIIEYNPDMDFILLDYNFEKWGGSGQVNGLEIAKMIKEILPLVPIVMTSEVGDRGDIAMKAGRQYITGFLDKPFGRDQIFKKLNEVFDNKVETSTQRQSLSAQEILNQMGFITESPAMLQVCHNIIRASNNDNNILILGETGTGKSFIAKLIHELSCRKNEKLIEFNCGSFNEQVIQSELFGHVKGAFTGAIEHKKGLFELAGSGTLFLDEFFELPDYAQANLLFPVGEQKFIRPVGNPNIQIPVKARIIGACSIHAHFREDVYERFTQKIVIPPLRDRKEDILILTKHFITKLNSEKNTKIEIDDKALEYIFSLKWERNTRQLRNTIYNLHDKLLFDGRKTILIKDLNSELRENIMPSNSIQNSLKDNLKEFVGSILTNRDSFLLENGKSIKDKHLKKIIEIIEKEVLTQVYDLSGSVALLCANNLKENKDTIRNKLSEYKILKHQQ